MALLKQLVAAGFGVLLVVPAGAQTSGGQGYNIELRPAQPPRQEGMVRIQTSINFFVSGPTGEGEDAQKLRDRAQRTVYEMAARECDLLREVLAKDCRMESLTLNVGRQFGQQPQDGYNVNGSMSFQITLK
jgi:hypothetical protein